MNSYFRIPSILTLAVLGRLQEVARTSNVVEYEVIQTVLNNLTILCTIRHEESAFLFRGRREAGSLAYWRPVVRKLDQLVIAERHTLQCIQF